MREPTKAIPADSERDSKGTQSNSGGPPSAPSISLPKGGGAIRGMGEKFAANPVMGTASLTVPIALSPARTNFGPQLSLSYDSGSGNGPFGVGWTLSLPAITRKTDKGLPRYLDSNDSDVFLLASYEDLVPTFKKDQNDTWIGDTSGNIVFDEFKRGGYKVRRYRPRVEGLFALIERWTNEVQHGDCFWRLISKDNTTTWYGKTSQARISDPEDDTKIFSWLISETYDDKGNVIAYEYEPENDRNINLTLPSEQNRKRTANRYLKRIKYGNKTPRTSNEDTEVRTDWMFEAVFDYDEGHYEALPVDETRTVGQQHEFIRATNIANAEWTVRPDSFSSYRSGFEIRTHRRCTRVLMFHHFEELGREPYLVRSTEFHYDDLDYSARRTVAAELGYQGSSRFASFLRRVVQSGYLRDESRTLLESNSGSVYLKKSLPPVEFEYSRAVIDDTIQSIDIQNSENIPYGLSDVQYEWVDLDGEGLAGVLSEQSGAWFYKRNLSPLSQSTNGEARLTAKLAPVECIRTKPNGPNLQSGRQLLDLDGDGKLELVQFSGVTPGFFDRSDESWETFTEFKSLPRIEWSDPNLRFVDLTGDGHADILITEDEVLTWYPSLAKDGFDTADKIRNAVEEELGPRLVFADGTQSVYLSDMSGDGLSDLVRIRNGEVCYWPNIGYGRFGAKITMDNCPWFDAPDQFNQNRIRLADVDGSGTVDIIYFGREATSVYFNQSGNSLTEARVIESVPQLDNVSSAAVVDLLGNGTACLVWSSLLPLDNRNQIKYVDLMGGQKPHLLTKVLNNLGAETSVTYEPSTRFYLADQLAGAPWVTKLPFPVHVVTKVSVKDKWRNIEFTSTYSYHHGYFDGIEREFRGFGRVEQLDVETFDKFAAGNSSSPYITNDKTLYQPPVKSITWFHTGAFFERERILSRFKHEYFPTWWRAGTSSFRENNLPEPDLVNDDLTHEEWREAVRACKGMTLRQELYELDVNALHERNEQTPIRLFSTAYHSCSIRKIQPKERNRNAIFLVTESEAITYNYDLDLKDDVDPDPRICHTLNLNTDEFGNIRQSITVAYPRLGVSDFDNLSTDSIELINELQKEIHLSYTETRYTNDFERAADFDNYRLRVPCEVLTYELTGISAEDTQDRITPGNIDNLYFTIEELRRFRLSQFYQENGPEVADIAYHERPDLTVPQKRLVEHTRVLYLADDLSGPLPFRQIGRLGLPHESYKLSTTGDLLNRVLGAKLDASTMAALSDRKVGGYLRPTANNNPFSPEPVRDEYWMCSGIAGFESDAPNHFYLPRRYTDPFGNTTRVRFDRYDLFVERTTDALGNAVEVEEFDFRVLRPRRIRNANNNLSTVVFDALGMTTALAIEGKGNEADDLSTLSDELINPLTDDLRRFFTSDYDETTAQSLLGHATARYLYHFGEDGSSFAQHPAATASIVREEHTVTKATSPVQSSFEYSDGLGQVIVKKVQAEPDQGTKLRWIANGKTVFNNKGRPVKQYEPYFSSSDQRFEEPIEVGVTPIVYYDAVGRIIRTELPDDTISHVEFSPWHVTSFDGNDNVLGSQWYTSRNPPAPDQPLPVDPFTNKPTATADERAAWLAARHDDTPSLSIMDSLGREVVTVVNNRVEDPAGTHDFGGRKWRDDYYVTFIRFDAESKPLWVRDPRNNLVVQYVTPYSSDNRTEPTGFSPCYDLAGNLLFQHSMDAGNRWILNDAAGKPMLSWDANEYQDENNNFAIQQRRYSYDYDELRRVVASWLQIDQGNPIMLERYVYHDSQDANGIVNPQLAADRAANLVGEVVFAYDASGCIETKKRDFKGNVLEQTRRLNNRPTVSLIDWQTNPESYLEVTSFTKITEYDALNRVTREFNWHTGNGSKVAVYKPTYNRRGLLESEELVTRAKKVVRPNGNHDYDEVADTATPRPIQGTQRHTVIEKISYNAKGQKERVAFGNGTLTQYDYDPKTFRLKQIRTTRPADDSDFPQRRSNLNDTTIVQQLLYTYDAAGNITEIEDQAYKPVFFANGIVEPKSLFEYDALYRLTFASGRETAQGGDSAKEGRDPINANGFPITGQTLRIYEDAYEYDSLGNFVTARHLIRGDAASSWTRHYECDTNSNRLNYTWQGSNRNATQVEYLYDTHGNIRNLERVAASHYFRWDHRDMIANLDLGGGGRAYYQYDSAKQRTRKWIDHNGYFEERIYLGGFERYRRWVGGNIVEEIESHHLYEGDERVLLVDDVLTTDRTHANGTSFKTDPIFRYQYSNQIGSVGLELDGLAAIISYEEFHPYGSSALRAQGAGIEASQQRFRFSGMERDEESGLNYHGARYYAAWLARWTSCDPQLIKDGLCVYEYSGNNPLEFVDRSGTQKVHLDPEIHSARLLNDPPEAAPPQETTKPPTETPDIWTEWLGIPSWNTLAGLPDEQKFQFPLGMYDSPIDRSVAAAFANAQYNYSTVVSQSVVVSNWDRLAAAGKGVFWHVGYLAYAVGYEFEHVLGGVSEAINDLINAADRLIPGTATLVEAATVMSMAEGGPNLRAPLFPRFSLGRYWAAAANEERLFSAARIADKIPPTGVPIFDELAVKSPLFEGFEADLRARGFKFRPGPMNADERAFINVGSKKFVYDPRRFTVLDMFHETYHLYQFERQGSYAISGMQSAFELQTYRFERLMLRMTERAGAGVPSSQYLQFLSDQMTYYGAPR